MPTRGDLRSLTFKELRTIKKKKGLCVWPGCEVKTGKRFYNVAYSYCVDHRKYFSKYQLAHSSDIIQTDTGT